MPVGKVHSYKKDMENDIQEFNFYRKFPFDSKIKSNQISIEGTNPSDSSD